MEVIVRSDDAQVTIDNQINRQSLIESIEASPQPVTSIVAPLGAGKTSLVQSLQAPTLYFKLTPAESIARVFFHKLTQVFQQRFPGFLAYVIFPPQTSTRQLNASTVTLFIGELNKRARQAPITIVLDELHHLDHADWTPLLVKVIESSQNVRWILTSESSHSLEFSTVFSEACVNRLNHKDLYFNQTDTGQYLTRTSSTHSQLPQLLDALNTPNGCWPYGVGLAQVYLSLPETNDQSGLDPDSPSLTLCLVDELLHRLPAEVEQFVASTTFLDRFNDELAQAILGSADCRSVVSKLMSLKYILQQDTGQKLSLSYHPVVREHLKQRFFSRSAALRNQWVSRACHWLLLHDYSEDAYHAAEHHDMLEFTQQCQSQCVENWIRTGNIEAVLEWNRTKGRRALPLSDPDRVAWCWALTLSGRIRTAEDELDILLKKRVKEFNRHPQQAIQSLFHHPQDALQVHMAVAYSSLQGMKDTLSKTLLQDMKILQKNALTTPSASARIENILAYHYSNNGQFELALHHLGNVRRISGETRNAHCNAIANYIQARLEYLNNDVRQALATCEQYDQDHSIEEAGGQMMLRGVRAYILYNSMQVSEGIELANELVATNIPGFSANSLYEVFVPIVRYHMKQKQLDYADSILNYLYQSAIDRSSSSLLSQVMYERFRLASLQQDNKKIALWVVQYELPRKVSDCLDSSNALDWPTRESWLKCALLYHLSQDKHSEAQRLCDQLLYLNIECGYPVRYLPIAMISAWIEYQSGRKSSAFSRLNQILTQAEISGLGNALFDDIPDVELFIVDALNKRQISQPDHVLKLSRLGFRSQSQ